MTQPIEGYRLAYFRILFGAVMLWEVWRYFQNGWIERYYGDPTFFFTYYGFEWVRPWLDMRLHFIGLGVLAVCIMLGWYYRLAMSLFCLGFAYVFLLDQTNYLNHFYFIILMSFLMIFVPAHRQLALDARGKPAAPIPAWALWMLRFQIGIVYFYAGLAKLNSDWLHGQPMRIWLAQHQATPLLGDFLNTPLAAYLFSYGGLAFDLLIFPLLLWRRSLPWALGIAVSFHLTNAALFNIGIFPWMMIATCVLFFPPEWLKPPVMSPSAPLRPSKWVLGLLGLYFALQLLIPLRHHLYPSDVKWSEEGHLFSWRMKLNERQATGVGFVVVDGTTGVQWEVHLPDYLTVRQIRQMSTRPEMILQFAHYLGRLVQQDEEGAFENPQVYAQVLVSLNGRDPCWLVHPAMNLLAEKRTWQPADWITTLDNCRGEPDPPR